MRWIAAGLLAFLFSILPAYAAEDFLNVKSNLQTALDEALIENQVSGMQATVILPNEKIITVSAGYTQKDGKKPITKKTIFQIGSDTKSFTAALMLKLQNQGLLKLSDTIDKYFPEYTQWKGITISQMLHNNSGIYNYSEDKDFQKKLFSQSDYQWTASELIGIAASHPVDFSPGKGWHYSNTNFVLAGMIAEKVTGYRLDYLFENYFLDRQALKLKDTFYWPTSYPFSILKRMAHGYDENGQDITFINMSWANAAGAMISNSENLASWAYDIFHGKAVSNNDLNDMQSLVSVKTGHVISSKNTNEGYGLGVGMRTSEKFGKWWGHEGETIGYHAIFIWFPDYDLTAAVIANGEAKNLRAFASSLPGVIHLDKQ